MKSTNYLIELIIAGLSTLLWVSLLILSFIDLQTIADDYDFINKEIPYITITALALPLIYVAGVIVDRIFDSIIDKLHFRKRKYEYLKTSIEYDVAKAKIYLSNDAIVDKFESYRTKIRICRTWIFSSILIWVSLLIFKDSQKLFLTQYDHLSAIPFEAITLILPVSAILSYIAWRRLSKRENKFLHFFIKETKKQGTQNVEIERKFFVKMDLLPIDLNQAEFSKIRQWYISKIPVIRIRNIDEKYILGIKSKGTIERVEHEMYMTEEEFQSTMGLIKTKEIEKYRYKVLLEHGLVAEVDVFKSPPYEDLITVEVEFESMDDAISFDPPKWFGKDISYNPKFKNSNMAIDL